ncbi:MAG: hypothetical protein ABR581_03110 [Thermoleophilaceae bacterium]
MFRRLSGAAHHHPLMRRIRSALLLAALCLAGVASVAAYPELVDHDARASRAKPGSERTHCGGYRWRVKTLADRGAGAIDPAPRTTTMAALSRLSRHHAAGIRIAPLESHVWRLRGVRLAGFRLMPDGDVHLVLADRSGRTMISEFPAPACDRAAPRTFRTRIDSARARLLAGRRASRGRFRPLAGHATVTGVGFFDYGHEQRGAARNAVELHPVLSISPEPRSGGRQLAAPTVTG